MNRLTNKVALVTGGATGIGEAISKLFAREGARVVVAGLPDDPVDRVANEIRQAGGDAIGFTGDISFLEVATQCVRRATDTYGQLDILINNAGVFVETNEVQDYTEHAFDYMLRNNVRSTFIMTKAALPALQQTKGNRSKTSTYNTGWRDTPPSTEPERKRSYTMRCRTFLHYERVTG